MARKWLIISGAPWGATAGGQRYEQLTKALLLLGEDVSFFCPWRNYAPSPYEPKDCKFDVVVLGFPVRDLHTLPFEGRIKIYDICDFWEEGMVEGVSFRDEHIAAVRWADAIVVVSPFLAAYVHMQRQRVPIFVIPNALRVDVHFPILQKQEYVTIALWGSWYIGQEWWDFGAVRILAEHLMGKNVKFKIFGAADRQFPVSLPAYVEIKHSRWGIPLSEVISELSRPLVGIVPFKSGMHVSLAADPVKIYEYLALQGIAVVTNNPWMHPRVVSAMGDASLLLPVLVDEAIEKAKEVGKPLYVPTFIDRAREYMKVIEVIEGWRS